MFNHLPRQKRGQGKLIFLWLCTGLSGAGATTFTPWPSRSLLYSVDWTGSFLSNESDRSFDTGVFSNLSGRSSPWVQLCRSKGCLWLLAETRGDDSCLSRSRSPVLFDRPREVRSLWGRDDEIGSNVILKSFCGPLSIFLSLSILATSSSSLVSWNWLRFVAGVVLGFVTAREPDNWAVGMAPATPVLIS